MRLSKFRWAHGIFLLLILLMMACSSSKQSIEEGLISKEATLRVLKQNAMENPNDPTLQYQLAQVYFDLDSLELAHQSAMKAVQIKDDFWKAKLLLAKIQLELDSVAVAYRNFFRILDSDSGDVYVAEIAAAYGHPYKIHQLTTGDYNNAYAYPAPDDRRVVFQSDRDGNWEIYMIDMSGKSEVRLTNNDAADEMPVFSDKGQVIAFTSTRDDTSKKSRLRKTRNIFLMDLESQKTIREISHEADDWYPSLAGDKWLLAFASERDDPRDVSFSEKLSDIYIKHLSSGEILRLTQNEADDSSPSFSADGKWILFTSNRTGKFQLYRMNRKGAAQEQLTDLAGDCGAPHYSHDGKLIAFFSNHQGNFDIFMMDSHGENLIRLTNNPANDAYPVFSFDKRKIFFHSNRSGKYQIYWIDLMNPLDKMELMKEIKQQFVAFK